MRRNSTQLELATPGATTWLPWVSNPGSNRVDGYPNFNGFAGQSRTIREAAWQAFLDSGEELEIIPDPPPPPEPDWVGFNVAMRGCTSFQTWFGFLSPLDQQAVVATSVNGNAPALQVAITMAAASVPYSPASGEEWAGIASQYGIPLTL